MNRALLNSKSTINNFLSLSLSVPCLEKISDSKWYRQMALCQCNLWASFAKTLLYFVLRNKVIILASSLHCIQNNCGSVWWVSADTSEESTAYITFKDARTSSRYCEGRAEPDGSLWGGRRGYSTQCGRAEPESHGLSYLPSKEQCIGALGQPQSQEPSTSLGTGQYVGLWEEGLDKGWWLEPGSNTSPRWLGRVVGTGTGQDQAGTSACRLGSGSNRAQFLLSSITGMIFSRSHRWRKHIFALSYTNSWIIDFSIPCVYHVKRFIHFWVKVQNEESYLAISIYPCIWIYMASFWIVARPLS